MDWKEIRAHYAWNKAAIAGVILDPVDAALAALPPAGPITLLGAGNGNTTSASAPVDLATVTVPQLAFKDYVEVSLLLTLFGGAGNIPVEIGLTPNGGSYSPGVQFTGAVTGGGDLNSTTNVGLYGAMLRAIASGETETLGWGSSTGGATQARGFTFAKLALANFLNTPNNTLTLRMTAGLPGGATLYWAWNVCLVKG